MAIHAIQKKSDGAAAAKSSAVDAGGASALKSSLRGKSFADGEAALAPVQMKGGADKKGAPAAKGAAKPAAAGKGGAADKGAADAARAKFERSSLFPLLTEQGKAFGYHFLEECGDYAIAMRNLRQTIDYPGRPGEYWQPKGGKLSAKQQAAVDEVEIDKRHDDFKSRFRWEPFQERLTDAGQEVAHKYYETIGLEPPEGIADYDAAVAAFKKETDYKGAPNKFWKKGGKSVE